MLLALIILTLSISQLLLPTHVMALLSLVKGILILLLFLIDANWVILPSSIVTNLVEESPPVVINMEISDVAIWLKP